MQKTSIFVIPPLKYQQCHLNPSTRLIPEFCRRITRNISRQGPLKTAQPRGPRTSLNPLASLLHGTSTQIYTTDPNMALLHSQCVNAPQHVATARELASATTRYTDYTNAVPGPRGHRGKVCGRGAAAAAVHVARAAALQPLPQLRHDRVEEEYWRTLWGFSVRQSATWAAFS